MFNSIWTASWVNWQYGTNQLLVISSEYPRRSKPVDSDNFQWMHTQSVLKVDDQTYQFCFIDNFQQNSRALFGVLNIFKTCVLQCHTLFLGSKIYILVLHTSPDQVSNNCRLNKSIVLTIIIISITITLNKTFFIQI